MASKKKRQAKILGIDEDLVMAVANVVILDPDSIDDLIYHRPRRGHEDPFPGDTSLGERRRIVKAIRRLVEHDRSDGTKLKRRVLLDALDGALRSSAHTALDIEEALSSVRGQVNDFKRERNVARRCFEALGATKAHRKQFARLLSDSKVSERVDSIRRGLSPAFGETIDQNHRRASELAARVFGDDF
jgi:hypothetical protein